MKTNPESLQSSLVVLVLTFLFELFYRFFTKVKLKEYIDWRLEEGENIVKNFESVVLNVKKGILNRFKDAEMYVEGNILKSKDKAGHINLVIFTDEPIEDLYKEETKLKKSIGLEEYHPIHFKILRKKYKGKYVKKSKQLKGI